MSLRPPILPVKVRAMSLLETLVAITVFLILMVVSLRLIDQASSAWRFATSKVEQFREGRGGLSFLQTRLSKATLNEYLGYEFDNSGFPTSWGRRSELRFISGPASTVAGNTSPTHAIFFTAPLGVTADQNYEGLEGLLNVCGYFIEWSNQDADRPAILPPSDKYRFRLMQFLQPAEEMNVYAETVTASPQFAFKPSPGWQKDALAASPGAIRPVAENVVALIVLPATSTDPDAALLSSNFLYDSESTTADPAQTQRNRLPPVVKIILYTIDEVSAKKLESSSTMPDLYGSLFTDATKLFASGGDPGDLARFEQILTEKNLCFSRKEAVVELVPRPWSTTKNL